MRSLCALIILLLLGFFLVPTLRYVRLAYRLWRWRKALKIQTHETCFHDLYQSVNGFQLSQEARLQGDALEYLYGEIEFTPYIALLHLTHPAPNTIFYDLGSGTGKVVIATAMLFNMKKYVGIELFHPLHFAAQQQKKQLSLMKPYQARAKKIRFIQGDFLKIPFLDASLIFINATAFIGNTWENLTQQLEKTAPGTIIITITKQLISDQLIEQKHTLIQMSWGVATAYIYLRTNWGEFKS